MRSERSSSSGSSELTTTIARPVCAQPEDQIVDLALGADIDAARRLIEQQHARLVASHLPMTTFCWLPPDSVPAAWSMLLAADAERADRLARKRRLAGEGADAEARQPADQRQGDVVGDRGLKMQPLRLAVFGHQRDAEPARVARRADVDRLAVEPDLAAGLAAARTEDRLEDFGAARARAARQCRGFRRRADRS